MAASAPLQLGENHDSRSVLSHSDIHFGMVKK